MEANVLLLKTINELNKYSFFIPAYQRGYRWSDKEVIDLLNDINDFVPRLVDEITGEKRGIVYSPLWLNLEKIVSMKLLMDNKD